MRLALRAAGLASIFLLAIPSGFAKPPASSQGGQGSVVIVFKDGHRQSFKLDEITRIEFPSANPAAVPAVDSLSRNRFLGKWEVGDGSGSTFFITLYDDGTARKTNGGGRGKWVLEDGEARIHWEDGWTDVIRKSGSSYQKAAYSAGKTMNDEPDNVTAAKNTTPKPI